MKRSLLAVALAVLSAVAVAEPTLDVSDNGFRAMPETTSYQASETIAQEGVFNWNP